MNIVPYIKYHENGIWIESTMIDDKFNGIYQEYYKNGNIKIESTMKNGKFNGIRNIMKMVI